MNPIQFRLLLEGQLVSGIISTGSRKGVLIKGKLVKDGYWKLKDGDIHGPGIRCQGKAKTIDFPVALESLEVLI